ncbi:MAG: shikimate kinase [Candidatus Nanopelagicales bacterium]
MSGPQVVLVGAPGAGKTSVGRAVARQLGVAFADTDLAIEAGAGKPVADIFVDEGEPAFREMERQAVARALAEESGVLSLGGGAVLDAGTRGALRGHRVVWLRVSLAEATKRVGLTGSRPLLLGNVRGTLMSLLDQRTPLYEEVATDSVDTDGTSVDDVAQRVVSLLETVTP